MKAVNTILKSLFIWACYCTIKTPELVGNISSSSEAVRAFNDKTQIYLFIFCQESFIVKL